MSDFAHALIDIEHMYAADQAAIEGGVSGETLMENAGRAVTEAIVARFSVGEVLVLCGPGNNGGDGFVIARLLTDQGWPVRLALLGPRSSLKGDAAAMADRWQGEVLSLDVALLENATLVIDALFGAGLTRGLEGAAAARLAEAAEADVPIVAVDIPSGISGDSGQNLGNAQVAALTVTFFRAKPGHCLMPGRGHCGDLVVSDIGIPDDVLSDMAPDCFENHPALWKPLLPEPSPSDHKYSRGHAMVVGGAEMIGAARLATRAAQRIGAGMVTLTSPVKEAPLYRLMLESAVVQAVKDTMGIMDVLEKRKISAAIIGPGLGVMTPGAMEKVLAVLRAGVPAVLDADALSLFQETPSLLFDAAKAPVLITPHEGEFSRLFPDIAADDCLGKVTKARQAAERSGFTVALKGFDTVIASPDGRSVINTNATPYLATAGSGDVMAGAALGLLAQGVPVFEAACMAVWLHAEAGSQVGIGLIAEDLPDKLPRVLKSLLVNI